MPTVKLKSTNKATYVNNMFSKIAGKYDLLNNLMTFGMHKTWKEDAIKLALNELSALDSALDLCTGTGDLALIINKLSPKTQIIASDYCTNMLDVLNKKIKKLKIRHIETKIEDAENLSYKTPTFDLITIGFGLRNIVNREKCIENIYTALKPKGVFVCIDLGHPNNQIWRKIFFSYFYNLVPKLGEVFAKDKEAYTYLPESLKTWYDKETLKKLLIRKGFSRCSFKDIAGGTVAIHIAVK